MSPAPASSSADTATAAGITDAQTAVAPAARPERLWREVVGDELRTVRQTRGESLRRVATRARVSPQYLSEIERGFKEASSEILAALGTALDLSLVDLTRGAAARLTPTVLEVSSLQTAPAMPAAPAATAFALAA
ncbi:helix-turn-helix domain-containing protein [Herbiconiux solani]|uniref:helix-turn-helix domain-containing protein n=1 Tax=Herbiconiux solani TaxID=661329 RepID=UPI000A04ED58|nr:helix-turn-helix transcriptional regulator [Herbiconiux solani]